jgi:hypothetical protein
MNIADLHKSYKYSVQSYSLVPNHVRVIFPKNLIENKPSCEYEYTYEAGILRFKRYIKDDSIRRNIACSDYCAQIIIAMDIMIKAKARGMSYEMVRSILRDFDLDLNEESLRRKKVLYRLVPSILQQKNVMDEAVKFGVGSDYELLVDLVKTGGIK